MGRDWQHWHFPCKHFFGVFHNYSQWNWEALPEEYRQSSYLTQDTEAISNYLMRHVDEPLPTHEGSSDYGITAEFCPVAEPASETTAISPAPSEFQEEQRLNLKPCHLEKQLWFTLGTSC